MRSRRVALLALLLFVSQVAFALGWAFLFDSLTTYFILLGVSAVGFAFVALLAWHFANRNANPS